MNDAQEQDHFRLYVAGLVLAVVATVGMIKSGEHDKFESTAKAIVEDASNSAYRN